MNSHLYFVRHLHLRVTVKTPPCSGFAKGSRFLNMVMTFVLHPLSHYNTITKPHARFLLSFLEGLTIDFPSQFILSLIDVYRDTQPVISSFFLQLSRGSFTIFLSLSCVSSFLSHVCHRCSYCHMEWGPTSIEAATNRDNSSFSFFRSFHICTFFIGGWCDPQGGHGLATEHGCSPWHTQWWVVSSEHSCQPYC